MRPLTIIVFLSMFAVTAQDWPNLEKYSKANMELSKKPLDEKMVVFMGNSITEHWGAGNSDFFEKNPYVNRGISGQTTPQMLLRFKQDVIDLKPKVVIILAGTNDIAENTGPISLEQIRDNILSMVELAKVNSIEPIICSVLPAYDYPWKPGLNPNIKIPKLNELLQDLTDKKDIAYVDFFSEMVDEKNGLPLDLAEDGVHPNPKGYEIMEALLKPSIDKVLKDLE